MADNLASLLIRIQGKIESRTRRPWFDLQRSYYYKDPSAVKTIPELKIALEHFHVLLSENEYSQLFQSFPNQQGGFDFHAFAEKCYPREAPPGQIKDGRTEKQQTAGAQSHREQQQQQQQQAQAQAQYQQQQQQEYEQYIQTQQQQQQQQQQNGFSPASSSYNPSYSNGAGASLPVYVEPSQTQQAFGQSYNNNGVSHYYRDLSPQEIAATGGNGFSHTHGQNGSTGRSTSGVKKTFRPRLTYNRPSHQRFNESPFETSYPVPRQTSYPQQELVGKPRFEVKPVVKLVDVPRRHNISRSYNREGVAPPKKR